LCFNEFSADPNCGIAFGCFQLRFQVPDLIKVAIAPRYLPSHTGSLDWWQRGLTDRACARLRNFPSRCPSEQDLTCRRAQRTVVPGLCDLLIVQAGAP
jgi:hypothetical protein